MKRISFLAIFFVIASLGAIHAQQRTGFAYYDLDRLYDTIPSLFYDDTDYTPEGRLRWSGERYRAKVERAGAVIGRMAMPLAGVYGVENEEVVKTCPGVGPAVQLCAPHPQYAGRDGFRLALLCRPVLHGTYRNRLWLPLRRGYAGRQADSRIADTRRPICR